MPDSIFVLNIHTVPNASQTQIIGIHGDALKIKVKAPPVDGKVNDEMIDHLRKLLVLPKKSIQLISGHKSPC
ncbi:MAG: DUF167 domain-containing protein [Verrucomicrobiota bacterium]|nr:DUF167 domain-containing protein [Verrucomicrobiota bacterium]